MKMDHITNRELLSAYLKQNYTDKSVLVIYTSDMDSPEEFETLVNELDEIGYMPPKNYRLPDYLIIEMPDLVARTLVNKHNKGFIRMEIWINGVCTDENR